MIDEDLFEVVDRRGQRHVFKRSDGFSFEWEPFGVEAPSELAIIHTDADGDFMKVTTFFDPVGVGYFPKEETIPGLEPLPMKNIVEYDRMKSALEKISSLIEQFFRVQRQVNIREVREICLDALFGKEEPSK